MPAPGDRRRLVVLCCILAAVGGAALIVWAVRDDVLELGGRTDQGHAIKLRLDGNDRLIGIDTRIDTRCRGGHTWWVTWRPGPAWALFRQNGARVRVREMSRQPDGDGRTRWILSRLVGRVRGGYAEGTVRVVARFWRGPTQVQACESGLRRWTAGVAAESRLAAAPPARRLGPGYYYPSPPSLAGNVSQERRLFIEATDRTCAATGPVHDAPRKLAPGNVFRYGLFVRDHAAQLRALDRLGTPHDGVALHRLWLAYFRARVRLERRVLRLAEAGRLDQAAATRDRLDPMKMQQNAVGVRFGLRGCTANGPDRSPVLR